MTRDAKSTDSSRQPVSLRSLLSDTVVYGLGDVADRATGFILLPIITLLLDPSDYGICGLFGTSSFILFLFFSMGTPMGFFRFYTEEDDPQRRDQLLDTAVAIATVCSTVLGAVVLLAAGPVSRLLSGNTEISLAVLLVYVTYLQALDSLGSSRLQADGRPWLYLLPKLSQTFIGRGLGLVLVLLGWRYWGVLAGIAIGQTVSLLILALTSLATVRPRFHREAFGKVFPYGVSYVPTALSYWVMIGCDVFLIRSLLPDPFHQLGLYAVGQRISSIMVLVTLAFQVSWRRFAFRNMHHEEGPTLLAQGVTLFTVGGGYAAVSLALLGDDLLHWVIPPTYEAGMRVIPALTIAALFSGLADMSSIGLHKRKRPLEISGLTTLMAVLNIELNLLLIPSYGISGAATATLISQACKAGLTWWYSQRVFRIPVGYGRLVIAAIVFSGVFAAGQLVHPEGLITVRFFGWGNWYFSTFAQIVLVLSTPVLCFLCGFFTPQELRMLAQVYDKIRQRFLRSPADSDGSQAQDDPGTGGRTPTD